MLAGLRLNEKEDERATTRSVPTWQSWLISSSEMPSEKYSWVESPLRLVNARTATECGGGAKFAANEPGTRSSRLVNCQMAAPDAAKASIRAAATRLAR